MENSVFTIVHPPHFVNARTAQKPGPLQGWLGQAVQFWQEQCGKA